MKSPVNRMEEVVGRLMNFGYQYNKEDPNDRLFVESIICAGIRAIASFLLHPDDKLYISNKKNSYVIIKHGYTEYQIAPCSNTYLDDEDFIELFRKILVIYGINTINDPYKLQTIIGSIVNVFYTTYYYRFQNSIIVNSTPEVDDIKMHLRRDEKIKYADIPRDCTDFKNIIYLMYNFNKLCLERNLLLSTGLSLSDKLYASYIFRSFTDSIESYFKDHLKEHKKDTQYMYIPSTLLHTYFKISIVKKKQSKGKLHTHNIKVEIIKDKDNKYKIDEEFIKYFDETCNNKYNFSINSIYLEDAITIIMNAIYNTLNDLDIGMRQKFVTTNVQMFRAQLYLEPRFNPIIYIY